MSRTRPTAAGAACRFAIPGLLLLLGCGGGEPGDPSAGSVRLVDLFDPATAPAARASGGPRTEWSFDLVSEGTGGWRCGPDVEGLRVERGALTGRTTGERSVLHAAVPPLPSDDTVWAVEVRLRASAGSNFYVRFAADETVDLAQQAALPTDFGWRMSGLASPLAGSAMRAYSLRPSSPIPSSALRHLLVRPSDAAGAEFAIESLRVVLRREHLAEIPAGVGWHGLGEVYRETLLAHAPEALEIPVEVPERPLLDLAVGTPEAEPVDFRVEVVTGRGATTVLEERASADAGWVERTVPLDAFAGRRVTLRLALAAARDGAVGFWGAPAIRERVEPGAASDRPQSVIVILTDTVRGDGLEMQGYGRGTAPGLARLASEGVRFAHAQADSTWTKASVPSLLTSLYPTTHRVVRFDDRLPASAVTLAEAYREAGYATLSLSSVVFTGRMSNLHQGFEVVHEAGSLPPGPKTATTYIERLLSWLDGHGEVPFLVLLHLYDAHYPYRPGEPYDATWADPTLAEQVGAWQQAARAHIDDPLLRAVGMPTRAQLEAAGADPALFARQWRDWYDGSIRAMDAEIGRLTDRLREEGLLDRVALAVVSDHGEEFLDHDRTFHGQGVYAELTRVPLALRFPPRLPAGTVIDTPVQSLDLMPTLLDLSGLEPPESLQGRSLLPLVDGTARGRRPVFSAKLAVDDGLTPPPRDLEAFSVMLEGWKLIHYTSRADGRADGRSDGRADGRADGRSDGGPEFELFRYGEDPFDRHDVAAENPNVVARLVKVIAGWRQQSESWALERDDGGAAPLSQEQLARLRSLGYVE